MRLDREAVEVMTHRHLPARDRLTTFIKRDLARRSDFAFKPLLYLSRHAADNDKGLAFEPLGVADRTGPQVVLAVAVARDKANGIGLGMSFAVDAQLARQVPAAAGPDRLPAFLGQNLRTNPVHL